MAGEAKRISEQKFNWYMEAAMLYRENDYSLGYIRGLRCHYYPEFFGDDDLAAGNEASEMSEGFHDGLMGKMFDLTRMVLAAATKTGETYSVAGIEPDDSLHI